MAHTRERTGHMREHGSLFARREKQLLIWIAERLPSWVNSDHLTALGFVAMVGAGASYWASNRHDLALLGVVAGLGVNWFGDSLDGTVARVRNQQRPMYGFYVDHVIDITSALFLFGGLGVSPYMSPTVAMLLLVAYLMVSAEVYLATHARGRFRISQAKIGPTELRVLLACGTMYLYHKPVVELFGVDYLLFDVGGVVAIVGLLGAMLTSAVENTIALYRAEPLPGRAVSADPAGQWARGQEAPSR